jgi:putative hydrolase of the HAD superfamily
VVSERDLDPRDVEVVFLDAGGVLLNPDWERGSKILADYGIEVTPAQLVRAELTAKRQMDDAGFVHGTGSIGREDGYLGWVVGATGVPFDPEALHAAAADFEAEHLRDNLWSDMPAEVPGALGRLQDAGYRMGVISNAEQNLRDRIVQAGLEPFFETLVISAEVGSEKPDRVIFDEALHRMAVTPDHAIHVGDFYALDVVGARGAGMTPILFDMADLFTDRDCIRIGSLSELAGILRA